MTYNGEDLIGGPKRSATNPKNNRAVPSYVEQFIDKAIIDLDADVKAGVEPSGEEKLQNLITNRHFIVDEALRQNSKLDRQQTARMLDAILERRFTMPTIKRFAVLDTSGEMVSLAEEIHEELGMEELPTIEGIETLATVCRAVLHWVMVHHGQKENTGLGNLKTPFMAWRLKEAITETVKKQPIVEVEPKGFDNDKNAKQFQANLNVTDLVLWNDDIWLAAIRGCQSFMGTPVTKELLRAITPMFWMFEKPVTLNLEHYYDLDHRKYECIGFVIMPTMEDFCRIEFPDTSEIEFTPDPKNPEKGHIVVDMDKPGVRDIIQKAAKDYKSGAENFIKFQRHGFFVAMMFLPLNGEIRPLARFLQPLYEDDDIPSDNGLYSIIMAATKFLTLKYVGMDNAKVSNKELKQDRHLFKQVRKGKVQIPPIKIINLRRPEVRTRHEADSDTTHKEKREWSCHWFVDPHWRQQYYPSKQRHLPIRILTFVKGDLTKPLKPPREKVYKAVR